MAEIVYTNQRGINPPLGGYMLNLSQTMDGDTSTFTLTNYGNVPTEFGNFGGYKFILKGENFSYNHAGNPAAGTITGLEIRDASGNTLVKVENGLQRDFAAFFMDRLTKRKPCH
ncbi:hypothetical protein [Microvirga arabica]|uniref:Uncharacterized protein n=2 Tax=Microvirga arabica TaxID=1128671 RepID=A0ABV6YEJ4_9HYPH|nr:hypothetical protein [Microvirga arabica]MBM1170680.1 hypothetical protein [Microvirga arabica]